MAKDIIKNIPLTLDINARKRLDGSIDIRLYSKDIATGQFEFTLVDEDNNPVELDETYSAQTLVKYEDEEKTYLDDMTIEGNIIRFIFPHDFITKDGTITMYIYITKDSYTSDVAAISFNVYRSEIDDVATDIVAAYDKNYEDILAEFKQTLEDYKSTLPKADSVRVDIDEILNQFSEDSQAKLSQYDTDVQQVITDINEAETSRVEAEGKRESAETSRKANEADRDQAESERQTNETKRQTIFETNESERDGAFSTNETVRQENETTRQQAETQRATAESSRVSAEEQREIDHANRSAEFDGKADKVVLKNLVENGNFSKGLTGFTPISPTRDKLEKTEKGLKVTSLVDANDLGFFMPKLNLTKGNSYYIYITHDSNNTQLQTADNMRFQSMSDSVQVVPLSYSDTLSSAKFNAISDFSYSYFSAGVRVSNPNRIKPGDTFTINHLGVVDLTETFGAGNEPTKEEMDRLIEVTGYIDGEYALNNKEMLGYLMKGISEKANKKQEDWITVPVYNGVQHGKSPLKVMKDNMGVVHFKGSLTNLKTGSKSFSVPIGYRPDISVTESVIRIPVSLNTTREFNMVQINYIGDAYINNPLAEQIAYFDGVSYVAKRG